MWPRRYTGLRWYQGAWGGGRVCVCGGGWVGGLAVHVNSTCQSGSADVQVTRAIPKSPVRRLPPRLLIAPRSDGYRVPYVNGRTRPLGGYRLYLPPPRSHLSARGLDCRHKHLVLGRAARVLVVASVRVLPARRHRRPAAVSGQGLGKDSHHFAPLPARRNQRPSPPPAILPARPSSHSYTPDRNLTKISPAAFLPHPAPPLPPFPVPIRPTKHPNPNSPPAHLPFPLPRPHQL